MVQAVRSIVHARFFAVLVGVAALFLLWRVFLSDHGSRRVPPTAPLARAVRVVCVGDTHGRHGSIDIPAGDVLIHSGDFSMFGDTDDIRSFNEWLGKLPHRHKLVVSGNHDGGKFRGGPGVGLSGLPSLLSNARYVQDETVELDVGGEGVPALKVFGSPWQPQWAGFETSVSEDEAARRFAHMPRDVDVLVTHTPPFSVLDRESAAGPEMGSKALLGALRQRSAVGGSRSHHPIPPLLSCFGHIHSPGGRAASVNWAKQSRRGPLATEDEEIASFSSGSRDSSSALRTRNGRTMFVNGAAAMNTRDREGYYNIRPDAAAVAVDIVLPKAVV